GARAVELHRDDLEGPAAARRGDAGGADPGDDDAGRPAGGGGAGRGGLPQGHTGRAAGARAGQVAAGRVPRGVELHHRLGRPRSVSLLHLFPDRPLLRARLRYGDTSAALRTYMTNVLSSPLYHTSPWTSPSPPSPRAARLTPGAGRRYASGCHVPRLSTSSRWVMSG